MQDRSALGQADVSDDELTLMLADLLGADAAETVLLSSYAEPVPYEIPSITTAARHWVRGTASVAGDEVAFVLFVKQVQSWARSPLFAGVPEELRDFAESTVPWRTEPLVYRSDLRDRLPDGLTMPRAVGVFELDEKSAAVWLEVVDADEAVWDLGHHTQAARLLGRLAASPRVRELATVGLFEWSVWQYFHGRLAVHVLPLLRDPEVWAHPLVAAAFDDELRGRLLDVADRTEAIAAELAGLPEGTLHGDACPNNLLVRRGDAGFVLIDFGFWNLGPLGFDLGQLLVGDVQVARGAVDDLPLLERAIVPAYVEGLELEGCTVPESVVRRAHALHLMLFTGLTSLPFEHLDDAPSPALAQVARDRAAITRFSLDLLEATE